MKILNTRRTLTAWTLVVLAAAAAPGTVGAQPVPAAPVPVTGAQLQAWFDADGMPVAGVNVTNGCNFIAQGKGQARFQTVFCPSQAQPFTVTGEAKVVGDQLCSKFLYPDGNKFEMCQDVVRIGDNKYEFRAQGQVRAVVYRLTR